MSESESRLRNMNLSPQVTSQSGDEKNSQVERAAIYARTSSPNQRFGYSLDEQVERCWEKCEAMGWEVRFVHKDEAESGGDLNRPHFKMMMGQAKAGVFDVIVFWKLDRLCRSLIDLLKVEEQLRKWDVALHSVTEHIDTTTPVGRFNFRNLASAAELERGLIKQRTRMGMHALAKQHKWPNDYPPLGYGRDDDGRLVVDEEEASLVRRVFLMYIDRRSMPQVAHELNEDGIRTRRGKEWSAWSVKKVLDDELYIGEYSVAGVEDQVEEYRILENSLFEKAQEVRERFRHEKEPMPKDRREKKIGKMFNRYSEFLDEMEEEEASLQILLAR